MIKKLLALTVVALFALMLSPLLLNVSHFKELGTTSKKYVTDGANELGAANLVTSIVVTYRGLDTLGEVTVLFIATSGVAFLLSKREEDDEDETKEEKRDASEILKTAESFLLPFFFLFGAYIFVHGHLTPGGGFQGGVVIASGVLLYMLSGVRKPINHSILGFVESISGVTFVVLALLGLLLAGGFIDNRFLSLGKLGSVFSAGAIPLIYSFIGLKVGSELSSILDKMS